MPYRVLIFTLGFFALCLAYVLGTFLYGLIRYRVDKSQREKIRRTMLNRLGRVTEGTITDLDERALYYHYTVNGVPYSAAQDVSAIVMCLPEDRNKVVGEGWVKFDSNNPANSIVVCEHWSGFRESPGKAAAAGA